MVAKENVNRKARAKDKMLKRKLKNALCKHYRDHATHGNCLKGANCQYSHNKSKFMDAEGKLHVKPVGGITTDWGSGDWDNGHWNYGTCGPEGDASAWNDSPIGLQRGDATFDVSAAQLYRTSASGQLIPNLLNNNQGLLNICKIQRTFNKGESRSVKETPNHWWVDHANDHQGTQFHTRVRVGGVNVQCMLDGGSIVNTVTESYIVNLLNQQERTGVTISDQRHPVIQLEQWPEQDFVRDVAGNKPAPLVGGVVLRVMMLQKGTDKGPEIKVRFKILATGHTDWLGMIMGARAIDDISNGGLGHSACPHAHWMAYLQIMMDRIGATAHSPNSNGAFGIRHIVGAFDSDDEHDATQLEFMSEGATTDSSYDLQ